MKKTKNKAQNTFSNEAHVLQITPIISGTLKHLLKVPLQVCRNSPMGAVPVCGLAKRLH